MNTVEHKPTSVNFYKLGGTWDMVIRDGRKVGTGTLDDDALKELQQKVGIFTKDPFRRSVGERILANLLYNEFRNTQAEPFDASEHLSSWCRNNITGETFADYAKGPFTALFSGDSSHLRNPIIAPMITALIERAIQDPTKPILGGQGTDTADIALLGIYDVLTYDTHLPPLLLAGANRSHHENNSDAPGNFLDLGKISLIDLGSGAFWVFQGNLYKGSDFTKIDPEESRSIEGQSTFFSSHGSNQSIKGILEFGREADWSKYSAPPEDHITHKLRAESLYDAFESVYVDDLGNQNSVPKFMDHLLGPDFKAIIIGAHSLGNVDNETRFDLIEAAKDGKLVIDASRTLISATNQDYEASLLSANSMEGELKGTGSIIISAHKLSKTIARVIAVRALLEGMDQAQTQILLDNYAHSRKLS